MALVIEDGTIVSGANSYTTDAEFSAFATSRGFTIPSTEPDRDILQLLAMDWLNNFEYKGSYVNADTQALPFPRSGVFHKGRLIPSELIHSDLKTAQLEAAYAANTQDLLVNSAQKDVSLQTVGPLTIEYFKGGSKIKPRLSRAMSYLKGFLASTNRLVRT